MREEYYDEPRVWPVPQLWRLRDVGAENVDRHVDDEPLSPDRWGGDDMDRELTFPKRLGRCGGGGGAVCKPVTEPRNA